MAHGIGAGQAPHTAPAGAREARARYLPTTGHGLIGDLHTVALVGTDGTIDWYCCPRFDSPSVHRGGRRVRETRGGRRDLTYSRLMSWVAVERAIRIARQRGLPAELPRCYAAFSTDGGGTTVTVCQDKSGTDESSRRAAEWVKENVSTTVDPPAITEGSTILQF
jgi:hypothetical protein